MNNTYKFFIVTASILAVSACGHARVETTRAGDATTSCYEVEDELVEINELVNQTDARDDVIARQKQLLVMLEKKNCL